MIRALALVVMLSVGGCVGLAGHAALLLGEIVIGGAVTFGAMALIKHAGE